MRSVIYRNLHKHMPQWSHAALSGSVGRGKVTDRADGYVLRDVVFHSQRGTADSIRRTFETTGKRDRNVHAWCVGEISRHIPAGTRIEVTYNPYRSNVFHTRDGRAVTQADCVVFMADGKAYAINPR